MRIWSCTYLGRILCSAKCDAGNGNALERAASHLLIFKRLRIRQRTEREQGVNYMCTGRNGISGMRNADGAFLWKPGSWTYYATSERYSIIGWDNHDIFLLNLRGMLSRVCRIWGLYKETSRMRQHLFRNLSL